MNQTKFGKIIVITGCMFAGKTEALIDNLEFCRGNGGEILAFKHALDTRYTADRITSHNGLSLPAIVAKSSVEIGRKLETLKTFPKLIGIDELQFFDRAILDIVLKYIKHGISFTLAGLSTDYLGQPFGCVPEAMAISDSILKLNARCAICGGPASMNYRISGYGDIIEPGGSDKYEPRCRACWKNN